MSSRGMARNTEKDRCFAIGLAIGMPSFAFIGFLLCIATDSPGLIGLGPAIGLAIGVAIGEGLYRRRKQHRAEK